MANGFRFTGPACCCCNNLYVGFLGTENLHRHATSGSQPGTPPGFTFLDQPGYMLDFDPVHKLIFATRGVISGDNRKVFRYADDFTDQTLLDTIGASELPTGITSDSDGERVFYSTHTAPLTPTKRLYVVNHDGSGSAFVANLTSSTNDNSRIPLHYCRANDTIFYHSEDPYQLFRINADGTGDTHIASTDKAGGRVYDSTIDNENEFVYWIDIAGNGGTSSTIRRANIDGTGTTTIYTAPALASGTLIDFRGIQWSHKKQRLYFWHQDRGGSPPNPENDGWVSIEPDGTDFRVEIPRTDGTDWWGFGSVDPINWRLGCGWETTGAGSPA
jgi:hypothetical protein